MGKKRERSKGTDPAAEVVRPLLIARPTHGDPVAARDAQSAFAAMAPITAAEPPPGPFGGGGGARLCYGEPVHAGERAVVPVAEVRMLGGWGRGDRGARAGEASEGGEGAGGLLGARPIGYIEVSADGSRYVSLGSRRAGRTALSAALAALTGAALVLLAAMRRTRG